MAKPSSATKKPAPKAAGHQAQHAKRQVPKQKPAKAAAHTVKKAKGRTATRALSSDLGCCVAEAVSTSLRLSGFPVTEQDIISLFWQAGGDQDEGVTIPDMIMTVSESGIVSCQLEKLDLDAIDLETSDVILGLNLPSPHAVLATPDGWWSWGGLFSPCEFPDAIIEEAWSVSWAESP